MKRIVCLVVCICLSVGLIAVPISNAASCEENSRMSFWSLISFERIEELYRAICEKLGFCTEKEEARGLPLSCFFAGASAAPSARCASAGAASASPRFSSRRQNAAPREALP